MATVEGLLGASAQSISSSYNQMGMAPALVMQAFAKLLEDMEERKLRSERMEWERQKQPIEKSILELQRRELEDRPKRESEAEQKALRRSIQGILQAAGGTRDPEAKAALGNLAIGMTKGQPNEEELLEIIREQQPTLMAQKEATEVTEAAKAGKPTPQTKSRPDDLTKAWKEGRLTTEQYITTISRGTTASDKSKAIMLLSKHMQDRQREIEATRPTFSARPMPGVGSMPGTPMFKTDTEVMAEGNQVSGPVYPKPYERATAALESVTGMPPTLPPEYETFEYRPSVNEGEEPQARVLPMNRIAQLSLGLNSLRLTPEGKEIISQKQIDDILKKAMQDFEYERKVGEPGELPLYKILEQYRGQ